jgi:hypothetical protein
MAFVSEQRGYEKSNQGDNVVPTANYARVPDYSSNALFIAQCWVQGAIATNFMPTSVFK